MDHRCPTVVATQSAQQCDKQGAGLTLSLDPGQKPRSHVQRSGQITLDVVARRHHLFLLTTHHPIQTDLRVEMDIYLILVNRYLPSRQGGQEPPDLAETTGFGRRRPGATHRWPGPSTPGMNQRQRSAHGRHVDADAGLLRQGFHQQLPGPGGPPPAVPLRRRTHHSVQGRQITFVEFGDAIVLPAIEQAPLALFAEASGDAVDGGVMQPQHLGGRVGGPAVEQVDDDEVSEA